MLTLGSVQGVVAQTCRVQRRLLAQLALRKELPTQTQMVRVGNERLLVQGVEAACVGKETGTSPLNLSYRQPPS